MLAFVVEDGTIARENKKVKLHEAGQADETGAGANRVRLITLTLSPPSLEVSHNYH